MMKTKTAIQIVVCGLIIAAAIMTVAATISYTFVRPYLVEHAQVVPQ